jgi:two-component system, HptB-dependent secretion and biofilm response regulator
MMDGLRILVADDNQADRLLLSSMLRKEGHAVVEAAEGIEALHCFTERAPELVLLDALMPGMDGLEVARRIKAAWHDAFVPIIFLTSLQAADELAACLDAGGDDFLTKPYNRVILRAKIAALDRLRKLHLAVREQHAALKAHHARLLDEQRGAKTIFDRVAHAGCLDASNVEYLISPKAVFNGDVLLAARTPSGNMHIFLGDFTGHGLPAAVGAMPLAQLFYSMTAKGFLMTDILREANRKLCDVLPTGMFCCAAMASFDFRRGTVEIWNGGLPAVYLVRSTGAAFEQIMSVHLPLGLSPPSQFGTATKVRELKPGERLVMSTDGIIEARDVDGRMFGAERLISILRQAGDAERALPLIRDQLTGHVRGRDRDDDHALVSVAMVAECDHPTRFSLAEGPASRGPRDWSLEFTLQAPSLPAFYPLPLLHQVLMEVPELRRRGGEIFAVLSELYSNAVDHGVAGLSSSDKETREGFDDYYERRAAALATVREGWIRFRFESRATGSDGSLRIRVTDSGCGFDYGRHAAVQSTSDARLHGRGLRLVAQLCDDLRFHGCGNDVEVFFRW